MLRIGVPAAAAVLVALAAGCGGHTVVTSPTGSAPASSPAAAARSAQVGDTLELAGNGQGAKVAVTVTSVVDPAAGANAISTAEAGKRLVGVQFRLHNVGYAGYADSPSNGATVIDDQGQRFSADVTKEVTAGQPFPATMRIAPGDTALGYLAFELPAASRPAEVQFTLDSGFADRTGQWTVPAAATAAPTAAPTPTPTAAPTATATRTVTVPPSARAATTGSPRQVVEQYYAALNARDYARAWALGGHNLSPTYRQFVDGFATTAADSLTVVGVRGDTVAVHLDALQTDGTHRHYAGTYTVRNGEIVAASIS
ncbi:DUF4352 domain-containing protein [Kitasatospora sp. KL5]|uniref:DUF4352 domain-containing protein n=1 Tax=Kitasatospora sp. KL5 TaxID=3425125 RepID=UPI003D6FA722